MLYGSANPFFFIINPFYSLNEMMIIVMKILSTEKTPALELATGDEEMTEEEWSLRVTELNKHQVISLDLITNIKTFYLTF